MTFVYKEYEVKYKEYEVNMKMIQEQWLQLKKFLWVYCWERKKFGDVEGGGVY